MINTRIPIAGSARCASIGEHALEGKGKFGQKAKMWKSGWNQRAIAGKPPFSARRQRPSKRGV